MSGVVLDVILGTVKYRHIAVYILYGKYFFSIKVSVRDGTLCYNFYSKKKKKYLTFL